MRIPDRQVWNREALSNPFGLISELAPQRQHPRQSHLLFCSIPRPSRGNHDERPGFPRACHEPRWPRQPKEPFFLNFSWTAMPTPHTPKQNRLLAALPAADYERLRPDLELIALPLGWAVHEPGRHQGYVYFPTTSIVSLLYLAGDGTSTEIAITGNDGLIGVSLITGGARAPSRAVVQSPGYGYRLRANILQHEFKLGGQLQDLVLRFTQALMTQMAQTAVCNRHHTLEQQLCRWLLLSLDRLPSHELSATQELIANMLGVRREGVTVAAGKLQDAGLIRCSRGHISVINRPRLETRVCECYAVVKTEMDRLLPYHTASEVIPLDRTGFFHAPRTETIKRVPPVLVRDTRLL